MKRIGFIELALTCALMLPYTAHAAPFCVQARGITPQCQYVDAKECRKRAVELAAVCIANPKELILAPGFGKYCLVDSNKISVCQYPDLRSCDLEARRKDAVCIWNNTLGMETDPYRNDANRNE